MKRTRQSGFALLEIILVLAVLAAAGFTAWWVYQRQPGATKTVASTEILPGSTTSSPSGVSSASAINKSRVATNVLAAPQVKSSNDLNSALQTLDQTDPSTQNNSDSSQLNSSANGF
ncbi:MAG: type II secretion system protein [Candidatus Micrarchaeaceae archaeon]